MLTSHLRFERTLKTFWLIASIACLLVAVTPVLGHAVIVQTAPAANDELSSAPDEIRLWFTEPLEPNFSRITLHDSSGKPVDTAPSQVDSTDAHQMFVPLESLPDGLYTVAWRVVSAADGHATDGSFAFGVNVAAAGSTVSAAEAPILPEAAAVRAINLLSLALAVGSVGFWLFVARGVLPNDAPLRRLAWIGWAAVGVASVLMLMLQTSISAGVPLLGALANPALGGIIRETAFGHLWLARLALWIAFGAALSLSSDYRRMLWIVLAAGVGMLIVQSLFSHASAAPDRVVALVGQVLHSLSAALWVGGLVAFALVLRSLNGVLHGDEAVVSRAGLPEVITPAATRMPNASAISAPTSPRSRPTHFPSPRPKPRAVNTRFTPASASSGTSSTVLSSSARP
jgi:copper transport protein